MEIERKLSCIVEYNVESHNPKAYYKILSNKIQNIILKFIRDKNELNLYQEVSENNPII